MMPAGMESKSFQYCPDEDFDLDEDEYEDDGFQFDFGKSQNIEPSIDVNNQNESSSNLVYEINNNFYCDENELALDDLKDAILNKNLDIVKEIMDKYGIEVNCTLKSNWTPTMYAVSCGSYELTEYFIERGADIHFDEDSYNLLMCACGCVDPSASEINLAKIIDLLVRKGADINQCDKYYQTPLMYACRAGNTTLIDCLIKFDIDLNARDDNEWTSLAHACSKGNYKCVHKLLRLGADPLICSIDYLYPHDIAKNYGFHDIKELIQNYLKAKKINSLKSDEKIVEIFENDFSDESSYLPQKPKDDIEIFLGALKLSNLMTKFQQNNVTISQLLNFDENDLKNIGVFDEYARQLIMFETKKFHHKNWLSSSLIPLKFDSFISCNDAVSVISNISRHVDFINQNIKYLIRESFENKQFYEDEYLNVRFYKETMGALLNCNFLIDSLDNLHSNNKKEIKNLEAEPIDLVKPRKLKKWSSDPLKITAFATIVISGIFIVKTKFFS